MLSVTMEVEKNEEKEIENEKLNMKNMNDYALGVDIHEK